MITGQLRSEAFLERQLMTDRKSRAAQSSQDCLYEFVPRLHSIWRQWGSVDYPNDSGVAFRNELFLFADWMLYFYRRGLGGLDRDSLGDWMCRNSTALVNLDPTELMQCIGIARMHMTGFWWRMHISRISPRPSPSITQAVASFGKQLDWIYSAHGLPASTAADMHRLVMAHIDDGDLFVSASKKQIGASLAATSLGRSDAASPEKWDEWATNSDMSYRSQLTTNAAEAQAKCNQLFSMM